jgi:hypothetical protein
LDLLLLFGRPLGGISRRAHSTVSRSATPVVTGGKMSSASLWICGERLGHARALRGERPHRPPEG